MRWRRGGSSGWVATLGVFGCVTALASCSAIPGASPDSVQATTPPQILFEDEFDDGRVDDAVWTRCYPWALPGEGCTNNPDIEREWYQPQNVTESDGRLALTARHEPAENSAYEFTSGLVSTGGIVGQKPPSFTFTSGYAEARVKIPAGAGTWPAFWLLASDYKFPPEIDIMEYQGVGPGWYLTNFHFRTSDGERSSAPQTHDVESDFTDDFHTYGLQWEPGRLAWFLDGEEVYEYEDEATVPNEPMYLVLNLAVGGWIPGQLPPDPSAFPASFLVDYVRVWDRKPD